MTEPVLFGDLERLLIPIGDLSTHPDNYNRGDVDTIAESLRTNGMYKPIVYDKSTGHVLTGNHTLAAAKTLGWSQIAAIGIDTTPEQARRILAVDNQSARRSVFDETILSDLLTGLPDLTGTGFTDADLDDLLAAVEQPVELPVQTTDAAYATDTPDPGPAATPEPTGTPAAPTPDPAPAAQGLAEIVLVVDLDTKSQLIRDLDAVADLLEGTPRGPACARAVRIALAVLDAADTNPELRRIADMADYTGT